MTADPSVTDWAAAFADANAEVRALTGRPAVPRETDLATYRDAEGKSRAREEGDDWAEVIAENRLAGRIDADPRGDDRAADIYYDKRWGIA